MANNPKFLLLLILSLSSIIFSTSQSFDPFVYNGFNNSNLVQLGATVIPNGALRLTDMTQNVTGYAFHPTPIPIFSTNNNSNNMNITTNTSSFSTYFVFQISSSRPNNGGYGLAFVLSPNPGFNNPSPGHLLGVFNQSNDGDDTNHIFLVEFDTVDGHNEEADTDGNEVGININGMSSRTRTSRHAAYHDNRTQDGFEDFPMERGEPIQAWVDYDGFNQTVYVRVAPLHIAKPERPLLSLPIDLTGVLLPNMYAGFSAATGAKSSAHYILAWSFSLNGTASQLDIARLPIVPAQTFPPSNRRLRLALIATFSVVLFVLVVALISTLFYRRLMSFEVLEDWELDSPHRFRYRDLYLATKGFKESEKIGSGGFGSVYKGVLPSTGVEIAVKKIASNNKLQGIREFAAEIESLGRLRHKNLVNLQGWCKYKNELLLVYDLVPNGSLDALLYKNSQSGKFLTWDQRFSIVKGVASGLLYLHEEWEQVVIHRDVKSSNVLIDRDMNARLGDFGLARSYDHAKNAHTTSVVGTIGYIAPELTRTGKASKSTDVFAYGILLLEVACGRGPIVYEAARNVILVDWVAECMASGNVFDAVDGKLNSVYDVEEMELVLGLGLLCSHTKAENRPSMRQVMKYLNGDETLPLFDELSSFGSRRVDEITSRFLALGLTDSVATTTATTSTSPFQSCSLGAMSSNTSFDAGR